jgi:hypothetical protein
MNKSPEEVMFAREERPETVREDALALPMEEDEEVREETTREEAFTPTRVVFPPMNKSPEEVMFAREERPETVREDALALPMEEDEEVREETTREEAFTPTRVVFPLTNKSPEEVMLAREERPETVRDDASALPMEEDEEVREETAREEAFTPTRVVFPLTNK